MRDQQQPSGRDGRAPREASDAPDQGVVLDRPDDPERPAMDHAEDPARREMRQGDRTKPPQPSGTTPLERDQRPINQSR